MWFDVVPLEDLGPDVKIAESLACPICHELLKRPVVLKSHFFCEQCLSRWLSENPTHPVTGEQATLTMAEPSAVLNWIVFKWQRNQLAALRRADNDDTV
jgi:hypothetical protein